MAGKKSPTFLQNIEITSAGAEGNSIARHDNKVIFVKHAVPGDVVNLRVYKSKKNFAEAEITEIITPSQLRVQPFCRHFGTCGGCKWQHMDYSTQLQFKHQQVLDAFERIGKLEVKETKPIIGADETRFYRNKLEYTFSNKRWLYDNERDVEHASMDALGFHIPGRFDKVLDVEKCWLQADPSNAIRLSVRKYALENSLAFFDLREQQGLLRNLIIRNSTLGEVMVIVVFHYEDTEVISGLLNHLAQEFPQITSLLYVINPKRNDTIFDLDVNTFKGKDHMLEKLGELTFKIRPKSFFQTNTVQAEKLYNITREFAGLTGNETVYDLYTGTGTIANYVAHNAKKVAGIEYIESAIEDAKENSIHNTITNTAFYAGDLKDTLNDEFIAENGRPDVIITDPPRAGMHPDVVKKINELLPEKVVYVSCNPATQARDIAMMTDFYTIEKIQPVDMFPHTHHVENVALLVKK